MTKRFFLSLLAAALLLGAVDGCSSDDAEPLPGDYRSTEFRLQTDDGEVVDAGADGGRIEMTLGDVDGGQGPVTDGRLTVPSGEVCELLLGTGCTASDDGTAVVVGLGGRYTRDGADLTFDLDGSDTFIENLRWTYNDIDGTIRAKRILDDHGVADYVVFLEKQEGDG